MPATPEAETPQTILAFDFGRRRIGVAVGQTVTGSASPAGIVDNGPDGPNLGQIQSLVEEWRPACLVVGLPAHADGSPSEMQSRALSFAERLRAFGLPVAMVDERYTSIEAEAALRNARAEGRRGRVTKPAVDAAAAVLIAERYLAGADASV